MNIVNIKVVFLRKKITKVCRCFFFDSTGESVQVSLLDYGISLETIGIFPFDDIVSHFDYNDKT